MEIERVERLVVDGERRAKESSRLVVRERELLRYQRRRCDVRSWGAVLKGQLCKNCGSHEDR